MSTTPSTRRSTPRNTVVTLLTPSSAFKAGNFLQWKDELTESQHATELGPHIRVLVLTNKKYCPPAVTQAMWNPPVAVVEGVDPDPALTPAMVNKRREACLARFDVATDKINQEYQQFYGYLWNTLTLESKDRVQEVAGDAFSAAQLTCDTEQLWKWIVASHLTEIYGPGDINALLNSEMLSSEIEKITQEDQSLVVFAKQYKNARDACNAGGCAAVAANVDTIRFLSKLNHDYDEMRESMRIDAIKEVPNAYPATIDAAVRYAAAYLPKRGEEVTHHQAFTITHEKRNGREQQRANEKNGQTKTSNFQQDKADRYLPGEIPLTVLQP